MDIITAKTELSMKSAIMQSNGAFSREINRIKKIFIKCISFN